MSTEDACTLLGVSHNAGFEEVLSAKKRLLKADQDPSKQRVNEVRQAPTSHIQHLSIASLARKALLACEASSLNCRLWHL